MVCVGCGSVAHSTMKKLNGLLFLLLVALHHFILLVTFLNQDSASTILLLISATTLLTVSGIFTTYSCTNTIIMIICTATHPCKTAICSNKTKCEEYPSSPRRSICQPSCDIQNGGCPHGDKCSLVNSTDCIVQPCPLTVKCSEYYIH